MEEEKKDFIEEYKVNISHYKKMKKYSIVFLTCLGIVLIVLITFAIASACTVDKKELDFFYILLIIPAAIMFISFIPFGYHAYKVGICPHCKKQLGRMIVFYCSFCGVQLQAKQDLQ